MSEFVTHVVLKKMYLGFVGDGVSLDVGTEIQYDGSSIIINGVEKAASPIKGAIKKGWLKKVGDTPLKIAPKQGQFQVEMVSEEDKVVGNFRTINADLQKTASKEEEPETEARKIDVGSVEFFTILEEFYQRRKKEDEAEEVKKAEVAKEAPLEEEIRLAEALGDTDII